MVGFRRKKEKKKEGISDREPFAVMTIFFINALVMMLLAGEIFHVLGISQTYTERIQAINPDYLNFLAEGNTVAIFLMVFSLLNVFMSAYFYTEWRAIKKVKIRLEGS